MKTIGFIGVGNMGGAMAKACANVPGGAVWVYDVNASLCESFQGVKQVTCAQGVKELAAHADYIVLSIKPQYYQVVAKELMPYLEPRHIVVTVAPSYSLEDMSTLLGEEAKVIRTMPNTPALIGAGVTAYCYLEDKLVEGDEEAFKMYFESFGSLIKVEEALMPAVVATTGSSPAYGYLFIEAMADAAVSFGMPRKMAYEMAAAALKGAAQMVLETGEHPGVLKDAVTSPGGTTIKAVVEMEACGFRNSVIKGMEACYKQVHDMSR